MKSRDYTTTLRVNASAGNAFEAINDVRGWWAGEIKGKTAQVGDEFTYAYENFHRTKQRVVELVPGKKIAWLVLKGSLNFVENKREWDGTRIEFAIARKAGRRRSASRTEGSIRGWSASTRARMPGARS
jgi:hypothetical protein